MSVYVLQAAGSQNQLPVRKIRTFDCRRLTSFADSVARCDGVAKRFCDSQLEENRIQRIVLQRDMSRLAVA